MKKIKLVALILVVVMVFTGCVKEDINIKLSSKGQVTYGLTIDFKKDTLDTINKRYKKLFGENIDFSDFNFKNVTIDGEKYYEASDSVKGSYKKIMNALQQLIGMNVYITKDIFYIKFNGKLFEQYLKEEKIDFNRLLKVFGYSKKEFNKMMKDSSVRFTIEFENEIVNTNGELNSDNNKKVTFNVPNDENLKTYTMFATTNKNITKKDVVKLIKDANTINSPRINSVKANKVKKNSKYASITVKYSKVREAKRYRILYSTKKSFKKSKKIVTKKTTVKISKLRKGRKYYIRVYAMKRNQAGLGVLSKASKTKSIKTKK